MRTRFAVIAGFVCCVTARAADPNGADLQKQFTASVRPFVQKYCIGCHGGARPMAQFDLSAYTNVDAVVDYPRWALVIEKLTAKQMPPQAAPQPSSDDRQKVIDWIAAELKHEWRATRTAVCRRRGLFGVG